MSIFNRDEKTRQNLDLPVAQRMSCRKSRSCDLRNKATREASKKQRKKTHAFIGLDITTDYD